MFILYSSISRTILSNDKIIFQVARHCFYLLLPIVQLSSFITFCLSSSSLVSVCPELQSGDCSVWSFLDFLFESCVVCEFDDGTFLMVLSLFAWPERYCLGFGYSCFLSRDLSLSLIFFSSFVSLWESC